MRTIVLGDTHGRNTWTQVLEKELNNEKGVNRIIFLGDYFDTHYDILPLEQLDNFNAICRFKKEHADKFQIILLIGNHDFHYWPGIKERYSGYQSTMRLSFELALKENSKLFQMCYVDELKRVFSHAGFTKSFVKRKLGNFTEDGVNDIWFFTPNSFSFFNEDFSGCGDDINQSCIWVRPFSLGQDSIHNLQIIGHTEVNSISSIPSPTKNGKGFIQIDCMERGEYLILEDEKITVGYL